MAMALTLTEPAKRSDVFFLNPYDIEVKDALRGRQYAPEPEAIVGMAMSLADRGQTEPVICRRLPDNKPLLVVGFTRCCAARMIREGFVGTDGQQRQIADFKLQVRIVDCDDKKAFETNIIENAVRNATSSIDDAHNHRKLRENYGYSDADIARLYQYPNQNKVSKYRKLLAYGEDVQLLIHSGKLGVQAAIDLLDLPDDQRALAIAAATTADGTVNGAEIVSQVREHHLSDDNVTPTVGGDVQVPVTPPRGLKPRTHREVKKFYTEIIEKEGQNEAVVTFAKDMLAFHNGKKTNKQGENAILRLLEVK